MLEHKKEKMERHISLMESERTGILWKSEKVGQTNLNRLFMARKNSVTVDLVSSVKNFENKKKWPNKRLLFNWVPKFPNTPEVSHILFSVP